MPQHYKAQIALRVLADGQPAVASTVSLLRAADSSIIQTNNADSSGHTVFNDLPEGIYILKISHSNYAELYSGIISVQANTASINELKFELLQKHSTLKEVSIVVNKPPIQQLADRTIINIDASITNTGSTILEVLEKSPGVSVDRGGNISLKGRPGVLVTIDNKPVYVTGADLITLLGSMNSGQAEVIEIIDNPPASFDASGNAGIINIKTKKNKQEGFNAHLNLSFGHGRYYKNNNSLMLNYRSPRWNYFLNYSMNANKNFMNLYALRTYYKADGKTPESVLEQPTRITGSGFNHTIRAGADYYISNKTTVGVALTGSTLGRSNPGSATALWKNAEGQTDSSIYTGSDNTTRWTNGGINFNLRQQLSSNQELTADVDYLKYDIKSKQQFENLLLAPGGYKEALKGDLDAAINIYTAKLDYTHQLQNQWKWQAGLKSSYIHTNNLAAYFNLANQNWQPDLGKTNHFVYKENIQALYTSAEKNLGKFSLQAGLRYEYTGYIANQLGNSIIKDSSFSRNYHSLFPSLLFSWQADSLNQFSITAGRRIERPAFQKLNPFVFVINKYTFQQGNPFFRPQYTWNTGFNYSFNNIFNAGLDYSYVKDYFSQIFLSDSTGTMVYTEGNVGRMWNLALSVSIQKSISSWWNISADLTLSHKNMHAQLWRYYTASFTQFNGSIVNQFRFSKGWSAELSGNYYSKSQQDIQEIVLPTGMVSAGVSKQVLKNKGTLKLTVRDIFYNQRMAGDTYFEQAHEYFKITRDTRVCSISFSYRFGKQNKPASIRSGGADAEKERVGNS